jgi:type III secretion protein J
MRFANVAAILLGAVVLAGCGDSPLYSDLTERQANEVQAALLSARIEARKSPMTKAKGWAVTVAQGDIPRAMAVLNASGLPRQQQRTLGEVFPKEGFVSSPLEERARYVFALSQEVERTLMQLDGIVEARVHIALPERNVLDETPDSASASVVIIERPGAQLEARETDIKAIVTDGVEGLKDINRVTVKFFTRRGSDVSPSLATGSGRSWSAPIAASVGILFVAIISGASIRFLRRAPAERRAPSAPRAPPAAAPRRSV